MWSLKRDRDRHLEARQGHALPRRGAVDQLPGAGPEAGPIGSPGLEARPVTDLGAGREAGQAGQHQVSQAQI